MSDDRRPMRDHERIEELISIRSLGGLDLDDESLLERFLDEHGDACEVCRLLRDDYAEVAGRLAFALAPTELREGFEDEVVALATGAESARGAPAAPGRSGAPASASLDDHRDERRRRRGAPGAWRGLAAAAAALALVAGGWIARDVIVPPRPDLADARVVAFSGERGDLAIAYRPGEPGAYLVGSDLPPAGPGRVLEVWMIRGDQVLRGVCLTPSEDGSLATFVDADLGSASAMAVTVEPSSCPSKPSTDPILTADLLDGRTL
jgi:anti-sigma-K factor RskA